MSGTSFFSSDPTLHALDVDHGQAGLEIERIMFNPAYTDPNHPLHARAVGDVTARLELLHGGAPIKTDQFDVITIKTGDSRA